VLPVQAMDYTVMKAVCSELSTKWTPAKIERIVQADRFTLLIGVRTVEQSGWLRLCWNPACAHITVGDIPAGVPSIAEAFSFGEQLRYLLKGLAIIEVRFLDNFFFQYSLCPEIALLVFGIFQLNP
jgi:predicted ribosome quality control (RQC) complex YloA/Tae2 family protein